MIEFDFINDDRFKLLLKRDFGELQACFEAKAFKAVLVLAGSIVEAVLLDHYYNSVPIEKRDGVLKMDLFDLVDAAHRDKVLTVRSKDLSSVVRNYRNLIHPGKEVRLNETVDEETASVAIALTKMIVKEIKEFALKQYGYTAEDILAKLSSDSYAPAIYEKLVEKISINERVKLLNELTNIAIDNSEFGPTYPIDQIKRRLDAIKPSIPIDEKRKQLSKLVHLVSRGNSFEITRMYNLYHSELDLLENKDRELVIKYILSYLKNNGMNVGEFQFFYRERTFVDIGKYIREEDLNDLRAFVFNFLYSYPYEKDQTGAGVEVFQHILNSLQGNIADEIKDRMKTFSEVTLARYESAKAANDLPF
jgi:hypothetical protein